MAVLRPEDNYRRFPNEGYVMSTGYGWRCADCAEESYTDMRLDVARDLIGVGPAIKALREADENWRLDIRIEGTYHDELGFLVRHAGHRLLIVSEYGAYFEVRAGSLEAVP